MDKDYKAKWIMEDIPGKPDGWPTYNLREAKIFRVWQRVCDFYKSPDPMHRDMMLREAFCRQRGDLPYEKWCEENERRYIIFYYNGYDYRGAFIDKDRKLKFETTAVIAPDYLLGKPSKMIKEEILQTLRNVYECSTVPDYYVCNNCFAKGVFPDGFAGKCVECSSESVTAYASKAFHLE